MGRDFAAAERKELKPVFCCGCLDVIKTIFLLVMAMICQLLRIIPKCPVNYLLIFIAICRPHRNSSKILAASHYGVTLKKAAENLFSTPFFFFFLSLQIRKIEAISTPMVRPPQLVCVAVRAIGRLHLHHLFSKEIFLVLL